MLVDIQKHASVTEKVMDEHEWSLLFNHERVLEILKGASLTPLDMEHFINYLVKQGYLIQDNKVLLSKFMSDVQILSGCNRKTSDSD